MPINGLTIGKDVSLDINGATGPLAFTGSLTSFSAKQDTSTTRTKFLDGRNIPTKFYDGWSGSFMMERQSSVVLDYFVQLEDNYHAGLTETPIVITETIQEVDGSVSQYRYTNVVLTLDDAGVYSTDGTVKQSVSFMADRCKKVI